MVQVKGVTSAQPADATPAYWTFGVGPGAHVLVNGLLDVVRDAAEDSELAAASVA